MGVSSGVVLGGCAANVVAAIIGVAAPWLVVDPDGLADSYNIFSVSDQNVLMLNFVSTVQVFAVFTVLFTVGTAASAFSALHFPTASSLGQLKLSMACSGLAALSGTIAWGVYAARTSKLFSELNFSDSAKDFFNVRPAGFAFEVIATLGAIALVPLIKTSLVPEVEYRSGKTDIPAVAPP